MSVSKPADLPQEREALRGIHRVVRVGEREPSAHVFLLADLDVRNRDRRPEAPCRGNHRAVDHIVYGRERFGSLFRYRRRERERGAAGVQLVERAVDRFAQRRALDVEREHPRDSQWLGQAPRRSANGGVPRDHDRAGFAGRRVLAQLAQQLEAVHFREREVEDEQRRRAAADDLLTGLVAVADHDGLEGAGAHRGTERGRASDIRHRDQDVVVLGTRSCPVTWSPPLGRHIG
jgi:hypothetical protein